MKDTFKNIQFVAKSMGIMNYLVLPLLPFFVFLCVPTILHLLNVETAGTVFTILLAVATALLLYNWSLIICAAYLENDDMLNRCWVIFFGQILCIIAGALLSRCIVVF